LSESLIDLAASQRLRHEFHLGTAYLASTPHGPSPGEDQDSFRFDRDPGISVWLHSDCLPPGIACVHFAWDCWNGQRIRSETNSVQISY